MAKLKIALLGVIIVVATFVITNIYTTMTPQTVTDYRYVLYAIGAILFIAGMVWGRKGPGPVAAPPPVIMPPSAAAMGSEEAAEVEEEEEE